MATPHTQSQCRWLDFPVPGVLLELLHDRRSQADQCVDDALIFAGNDGLSFHAASLYRRADRAWSAAGLTDRLRLHQARHTYASFMIAAGVNAKALATFMGHSSIKVTFDLYGHLMPGTEAEAAALLDAFLDRDQRPDWASGWPNRLAAERGSQAGHQAIPASLQGGRVDHPGAV